MNFLLVVFGVYLLVLSCNASNKSQKDIEQFEKWCQKQGIQYSPKIKLSSESKYGIGVIKTSSDQSLDGNQDGNVIMKDETLLIVPPEAIVSKVFIVLFLKIDFKISFFNFFVLEIGISTIKDNSKLV